MPFIILSCPRHLNMNSQEPRFAQHPVHPLYWLKSQNSQFEVAYVVNGVHFRTQQAYGACEAGMTSFRDCHIYKYGTIL